MKRIRKANKALLNSLIENKTNTFGFQFVRLKGLSKRSIALIMTASLMLGLIAFIPGAVSANEGTEPEIVVGSLETNSEQNSEPTPQPSPEPTTNPEPSPEPTPTPTPGVDDDSDEDKKSDESGSSEPGDDDDIENKGEEEDGFEELGALSLELELADEDEDFLELSATSSGGPSISLRPFNNAGVPLSQPWDYVRDFSFLLNVTIDPDGQGEGRYVVLTAPTGMRFITVANRPGITITYPTGYTSGATQGGKLNIAIANDFYSTISLDIPVITAGSGTVANQSNTAMNVGASIYNHGRAGNTTAPQSITTATGGGDWADLNYSLAMDYAVYEINNIFGGLYQSGNTHYSDNAASTAPYYNNMLSREMIMTADGQIIVLQDTHASRSYRNTTYIDNNGWVLLNSNVTSLNFLNNPKQPYWNLSLKVYIPDGLITSNPHLAQFSGTDGNGNYVYVQNVDHAETLAALNNFGLTTFGLPRMQSPIRGYQRLNNGNYSPYGNPANFFTNTEYGTPFALNLALVKAAREPVTPEKEYKAANTVVSYNTFDESGNVIRVSRELNHITVQTPKFLDIDAWQFSSFTSGSLDVMAGWSGNSDAEYARATQLLNRYAYNNLRYDGINRNCQHIGGTLKFEVGNSNAISLSEIKIERTSVTSSANRFWTREMRGGGTDSTPITAMNGLNVANSLRFGLPASTVVRYELQDGSMHTAASVITPVTGFGALVEGDTLVENLRRAGGFISSVSFPNATDNNRVKQVIFNLTDGLNVSPSSTLRFSYTFEAGEFLPDNVAVTGGGYEPALHRTHIDVTLRGKDGCHNHGSAADSSPTITAGGEHYQRQVINIRGELDLLLLQTQGSFHGNRASNTHAAITTIINDPLLAREFSLLSGGATYKGGVIVATNGSLYNPVSTDGK
ncbi:MAG: hypothetical protein LBD23_10530, partial [Oscillospiraceae bacterium]|nr:hypothetical protein [Oscillospiraceae bacterium]